MIYLGKRSSWCADRIFRKDLVAHTTEGRDPSVYGRHVDVVSFRFELPEYPPNVAISEVCGLRTQQENWIYSISKMIVIFVLIVSIEVFY